MMLMVFYTTPRRWPWLIALFAFLLGLGAALMLTA